MAVIDVGRLVVLAVGHRLDEAVGGVGRGGLGRLLAGDVERGLHFDDPAGREHRGASQSRRKLYTVPDYPGT